MFDRVDRNCSWLHKKWKHFNWHLVNDWLGNFPATKWIYIETITWDTDKTEQTKGCRFKSYRYLNGCLFFCLLYTFIDKQNWLTLNWIPFRFFTDRFWEFVESDDIFIDLLSIRLPIEFDCVDFRTLVISIFNHMDNSNIYAD